MVRAATNMTAAYEAALRKQGTVHTAEDLVRMYPPVAVSAPKVPPLSLENCKFYADFTCDPQDANQQVASQRQAAVQEHGQEYVDEILESSVHHELKRQRRFDFRLQDEERARLQSLGFVVSQRLQTKSFAELYYQLYSDDMPVYITTDSVLHAWHRSFDAFLLELEKTALLPMLHTVLQQSLDVCGKLYQTAIADSNADLKSVLLDLDLFLVISLGLLDGGMAVGVEENKARVCAMWETIQAGAMAEVKMMGARRMVDFSLLKPRGHYTKSEQLRKYFQALTWVGTIDFRVNGGEDAAVDRYQLQCAIALVHILRAAEQMKRVKSFDGIVSSIAGDGSGADSMTPIQLNAMFPDDIDLIGIYVSGQSSETELLTLQKKIAERGHGTQAIAGHPHQESLSAMMSPSTPTVLPTSFALLGQQFVWSAFVFSKLVYDQVLHEDDKVIRRLPSAVDAAFAMLSNDVASEEISKRMTMSSNDPSFVKFRDGVPFASNLMALRRLVDEELDRVETDKASLSTLWILALRELSRSSSTKEPVFQSKAWQLRQMNTQLASFTQLRHDTLLYAKQSFTMGTRCEYAAGYVDPYPAFWARMQQVAERCVQIVADLEELDITTKTSDFYFKGKDFFTEFGEIMQKLHVISSVQSEQSELNEEQVDFLKTVMEERFGSGGSRYLGWYPRLFYTSREDSGKRDHIVADAHTDTPSVEHGDPGGVLHLGVGDVNCGFFVVNQTMYAGPVFSSYEFVTPINERLTDDEFSARIDTMAPHTWATDSFLC